MRQNIKRNSNLSSSSSVLFAYLFVFWEKATLRYLLPEENISSVRYLLSQRQEKDDFISCVFPGDIFATSSEAAYSSGPANVLLVYSSMPKSW